MEINGMKRINGISLGGHQSPMWHATGSWRAHPSEAVIFESKRGKHWIVNGDQEICSGFHHLLDPSLGVACECAGILLGSCGTLHRVKHCECLVFYRFKGCNQNAVALIHQLTSPPMTQWMETKLRIIIKSRQQSPFLTRTDRSSRSYAA